MDRICRGAPAPSGTAIQVCFPDVQGALMEKLNQQREDGMLCDLSIHVQGQVFKAHRCVLAASSPYFHDQVQLKNVTMVSLPSVMDPVAFQSVLNSAYTGQLRIVREDIVNYVTVASFLQMWHIVDKCTEVLKQVRPLVEPSPVDITPPHGGSSRHQSPSSSDCYYVEPETKGQERGQDCIPSLEKAHRGLEPKGTLPPLATWRRPHLASRWRSQSSPQPEAFSQQQSLSTVAVFSPGSSEDLTASEGASALGSGSAHPRPAGPFLHMGRGTESGLGQLEGLADLSHLRERARGPRGGLASRARPHGWEREGRTDEGLTVEQAAERSMEADEGVGDGLMEETSLKTERGLRSGDCIGSPGALEGSAGVETSAGTEGTVRSNVGLSATSEDRELQACGSGLGPVAPGPPPTAPGPDQWPASPWLQQREFRRGVEEAEGGEEDVDFEHLGDGVFGGETYDEIEDGTGQVSQRPLLPSPDDGQYGPGQSDLSWVSGAGAGGNHSPSSTPFHPPGSPPIPSSSSPQSNASATGGPYSGRLHFCHCGKAYALKSMRDRHVKMQHLNLRPFSCPVCSKSFKMKHHLTKHLKTHGSVRPYECGMCGKKVVWRDSFLRHQARCERLTRTGMAPPPGGNDDTADIAGDDPYVPQDNVDSFLSEGSHVKVEKMDFGGEDVPDMEGLESMPFLSGAGSDLTSPIKTMDGHVLKQEEGERFS